MASVILPVNVVVVLNPTLDKPSGCGFRDINEEFQKKDAQILGVSFDTEEENKDFTEKFSFNFRCFVTPTGRW